MNKTQTIMNTIKWLNDTFVPIGLKPIEDLPKAVPGEGSYCIIAKVLKTVPAFEDVLVGYHRIEFHVNRCDVMDTNLSDYFEWDDSGNATNSSFELPEDIKTFIGDFDRGIYPELMDAEEINEYISDGEFKEKMVEAVEAYKDGQLTPIPFYSNGNS